MGIVKRVMDYFFTVILHMGICMGVLWELISVIFIFQSTEFLP